MRGTIRKKHIKTRLREASDTDKKRLRNYLIGTLTFLYNELGITRV